MWLDYATLPGSTESYSERTQACTFENHANLLTYMANWPLFTPENGFQGAIKHQGGPFLGFAQVFSAVIVQKKQKQPEWVPTKTQLRVLSIIDQLCEWAYRRSAYAQLSPLSTPTSLTW